MNNNNIIMQSREVTSTLNIKLNMYLIIKRIFDIFCSLIGLVFIIPLTIVIKVIYMLSGDFASVFYFHERIGKNGKTFKMFKYRND